MISLYRVTAILLLAASAQAGILILRSGNDLQFVDAAALLIGGKDKVLNLGGQPQLPGPINKLPSIKLGPTVLKDADKGALAFYSDGAVQYFVSDGLPKTTAGDVAAIWRLSRISYKRTANDKTPTDVSIVDFTAWLPGGVEELAQLCMDPRSLEFIGGKGKSFATQLQLSAAATKVYPNDPGLSPLERYVEQAMRTRFEEFDSGSAGVDVLDQGLRFAELSKAAYPNVPAQLKLRNDLELKRKWLDQKLAILRAMAAAGEWDSFLLADRDFERYRASFPDMAKLHTTALQQSLELHRQAGEALNHDQEYGAAYREFRLASMRKPSDTILRTDMSNAWGNYSSQFAKDHQGSRKALSQGERSTIAQDLQRARNYLTVKKPELAMTQVLDAEHIDSQDLAVLLMKAEVLGARLQFAQALAALDEYDKHAVDEERTKADSLRGTLAFNRDNNLDDIRKEVHTAFNEFRFHQAFTLAKQGLDNKSDDPDLLVSAGALGLILHDTKTSRAALQTYLDVTTTLDANDKERNRARQLLAAIRDPRPPEPGGSANWLSRMSLPDGVYYDPVSGAFQPRIDRIAASNKLTVTFDWDGDRLRSITPAFDKEQHVTGEQKIFFGYDGPNTGISWAGPAPDPRGATPADPDAFRRSIVRLANNPYADPLAIQTFTGRNMALGIAGNRFFDPFVWDKVHYFQLVYDNAGRLKEAWELADPKSAPSDQVVTFDWDGVQLRAVSAWQGADPAHRVRVYERTMQYQDNHLISEEIHYQGKTGRVKYIYNGGRLASATTERDASLDDRNRQVTFR